MPLIPTVLIDQIRRISDPLYAQFEGWPTTSQEVALRWSIAINTYASAVLPLSTTASVARSAFETAFQGIVPSPPNGLILFPAAFTAYAAALGLGMLPAFTGVPPPVPISLAPIVPIGLAGGSAQVTATAMAGIIDLWFRTGTAIPIGGGPPIFWN